jgi:hypothetical protein
MENKIITKSLKRQLVKLYYMNKWKMALPSKKKLSANRVNQRFETPRRVSQTKQRYSWTKERLARQRMH